MKRRWVVSVLAVLGLAAASGALKLLSLERAARRPVEAPYPPIRPDRSSAALSRGELIFRATCLGCHAEQGQEQATGAAMADVPPAFGTFHSRNLTSDPRAGIGGMSDESVARAIRYGVLSDGRRSVMPAFGMGDADLAAVLGFLRSSSPLFAPSSVRRPPSQASWLGAVVIYLSNGGSAPLTRPASGIPTPVPAPTAAFGEYLAHALYGCADCHTPGYASDKTEGEAAFSGGFLLRGSDGKEIRSANLTRDGTGLYLWTYADFARAVGEGIRPDGSAVRYPMPRFRVPEVELRALWAYLESLPRRQRVVPGSIPIRWSERLPPSMPGDALPFPPAPAAPVAPEPPPERVFVQLGCPACHAVGAAFHAQLVAGRQKPAAQLARWIRHPERVKPGTPMPTFASMLSEERALRLAEWIRRTPPDRLPRLMGPAAPSQ